MTGQLAILAGAGALPVEVLQARPDSVLVGFHGVANAFAGVESGIETFRFEKLGELFSYLKEKSTSHVVFAGSMARPPLDPAQFDTVMRGLAPRLVAAMQGGDDSLLRLVIDIFQEQGFGVLGAHEILPDITAFAGHLAGAEPSERALLDAVRAADIVSALSPVDVGQGAVVENGVCLGIETVQGTDVMLAMVAQTLPKLRARSGGVLIKAAKRGQDLRVDMPAIGPDTIAAVSAAGLAGIVIEAKRVIILEREKTLQAVENAGLFLISQVL
ncbi:MAG: UDP-2,3-diacylglucosamine diphosphatase LpxI [Rhodobacterales bacterium]|nr:UDP-2,3-diacylglucosamine diphosphatase LpxI [Rhodobacterales bacterium]